MSSVTYLLGAGASAEVVPVVSDIQKKLAEFRGDIERTQRPTESTLRNMDLGSSNFHEIRNLFIKDLEWLSGSLNNYASFDTMAKTFFLSAREQELFRLKVLLSLWFNFLQTHSRDKRYNSFFASVLTTSWNELPPSINVLSWNYDFQFELAYSEFSKQRTIRENQQKLNVIDKFHLGSISRDCFSIFKINGTASFTDKKNNYMLGYDRELADSEAVYDVLLKYNRIIQSGHSETRCGLSFAWEVAGGDAIGKIKEAVTQTKYLVIIGYSLPFFNRSIDKEIINTMPLDKVYIQDPYIGTSVKERFLTIRPAFDPSRIVLISQKDQFFLPNELGL